MVKISGTRNIVLGDKFEEGSHIFVSGDLWLVIHHKEISIRRRMTESQFDAIQKGLDAIQSESGVFFEGNKDLDDITEKMVDFALNFK